MAAVRGKKQIQIGSAQWIRDERNQIGQFEEQEIEDFAFSTRNEVEWLNEHMAEIFSNGQLNVTEVFKTPGKLRGKTPRTARKRNALETRAPLTEIFSADKRFNSPIRNVPGLDGAKVQTLFEGALAVAGDNPAVRKAAKHNTDSGYHGMTEDEMEIDDEPLKAGPDVPGRLHDPVKLNLTREAPQDEECRTTEVSFHSARENLTTREVRDIQEPDVNGNIELPSPSDMKPALSTAIPSEPHDTTSTAQTQDDQDSILGDENQISDAEHASSQGSTPVKPLLRKSSLTFAPLPAREPLTTKKSIGGNQVARASNADTAKTAILNRGSYLGRFTGGRSLGTGHQVETDEMDMDGDERPTLAREESDGDGSTAILHSKSSTQRLHERINLLGKTQPARATKSIPSTVAPPQPVYPELPNSTSQTSPSSKDESNMEASKQPISSAVEDDDDDDDDDDWIMPPAAKAEQQNRPQLPKSRSVDVMEQVSGKESVSGHNFGLGPKEINEARQRFPLRNLVNDDPAAGKALYKSISITALSSSTEPLELGHQKAISVSNPTLPSTSSTTTPPGSPTSKLHLDGHLSASKSKLQSIMKSARGLFSSSAKISSQAKMETMSPSSMRLRNHAQEPVNRNIMETTANGQPSYPTLPSLEHQTLESPEIGRKTRSSTEKEERRKEKEANDRQRAEVELEKARERERQKAAKYKEQVNAVNAAKSSTNDAIGTSSLEKAVRPVRQSPRRLQNREEKPTLAAELKSSQIMGPPARPQLNMSQIQKPKDTRRPMRPTKETAPKPKPQPVLIRVGSTLSGALSQKMAQANTSLPSPQDHPAPSQAKQPVPAKKASTASQQSAVSTSSFKNSISSTTSKPKSLIAAERKKEQDEREAQRKLEQKKEIERKRAAAQEEAQKRELYQRQEAEKQRERERSAAAEDAKKSAQKQVIEKRRLELSKKEQHQCDPQRVANDLAHALNHEKPQVASSQRPELGATKPLSRMDRIQDFPRPPVNHLAPNPAKPKRAFDPDQDDELAGPVRAQQDQNYQQNDAKRRRTKDEETADPPMRLAMAPPIRNSNIRKNAPKVSIFGTSNFPTAPPPASSHAGSSKMSTVGQTYQQPSYPSSTARVAPSINIAKYANGKIPFAEAPNPPPATYKTPLPSKQAMPQASKSSPMFPNGDNIHLEDIQTSEEEEDSEDEREKKSTLPDWVRTPNMNDILRRQETMNPDAVFGPIPPANVEEWFTKDKSRLHKLRARTSSANWLPDRVTEEEIRNDIAAREKMSREGGWTFGL